MYFIYQYKGLYHLLNPPYNCQTYYIKPYLIYISEISISLTQIRNIKFDILSKLNDSNLYLCQEDDFYKYKKVKIEDNEIKEVTKVEILILIIITFFYIINETISSRNTILK